MTNSGLKSKFEKGSTTYTCKACGKLTRDTGSGEPVGVSCVTCWYEPAWANEHEYTGSDHDGDGPAPANCPTCREEIS